MYPEWIQEQLDKLAKPPCSVPAEQAPEYAKIQSGISEARIIHVISHRLDRIEAKLDRLLSYCEGE